jgi:hypothetical protein
MPTRTCFVVMPFGEKIDSGGVAIKFDDVYKYLIQPTVREKLGFECVREDEVHSSAPIHRDMITRIALSDVVLCKNSI